MALDKPFSSFAEKCVELLSASTSETAAATLCCFSIRGDLSPHTHHTQLQTADQHPMQAKQFVHGAPLCLNSHSSGHSFSPLVRARDFNGQVFGKLWTRHDRYESAWLQFTLHTDFRWWGKEGLEFMLQPRINLRYTAAEWVLLCLAAVDLRVHMRGNCEAIASRVGLHTILAHTHKSNVSLSLSDTMHSSRSFAHIELELRCSATVCPDKLNVNIYRQCNSPPSVPPVSGVCVWCVWCNVCVAYRERQNRRVHRFPNITFSCDKMKITRRQMENPAPRNTNIRRNVGVYVCRRPIHTFTPNLSVIINE